MKTIIKPGIKTYKTTCEQCGCEFTYQDEDIITSKGYFDVDKALTLSEEVTCPDCGNNIFLRGTK